MKKLLQSIATAVGLAVAIATPVLAVPSFCDSITSNPPPVCNELRSKPAENPVVKTISRGVSVLAIVIGAASVIMIMVGGIRYSLSSGDQARIKSAKDTILYSVIGIFVAASAQLIVVFILNRL